MVYFGQLKCYEKCSEIIENSVGVVVGHSQVLRVADTYGKELNSVPCLPKISAFSGGFLCGGCVPGRTRRYCSGVNELNKLQPQKIIIKI